MVTILPQRRQGFACLLDRLCPITPDTRFTITPVGIAEADTAASKTGTSDRQTITDDTAFFVTLTGYVALSRAEADTRRQTDPSASDDAQRRQDGHDHEREGETSPSLTARTRRASGCTLTPAGYAALDTSTDTISTDTASVNTPDAGTSFADIGFAKDVPGTLSVNPSLQDVLSASTVSPSSLDCPKCGAKLGTVNLYCGGRGYVQYDSCTACEYQVRSNQRRSQQ